MRRGIIGVAAVGILLLASGCEPETGTIYFHNNATQTLTLRQVMLSAGYPPLYSFTTTAAPGTTAKVGIDYPKGQCMFQWEVVDASKTVLRSIHQVCDGDTVTYP